MWGHVFIEKDSYMSERMNKQNFKNAVFTVFFDLLCYAKRG
jgi:hypothetical protein